VLPDACTGQGPGTLATKLSRGKEGMAHFLPSRCKAFRPLRVSRYRAVKVLVIYQGAVKFIAGSGAIWVCQVLQTCLGSRNKSKKCDKQLTFIVRVRFSGPFKKSEYLGPVLCHKFLIFPPGIFGHDRKGCYVWSRHIYESLFFYG
jgi:hypothetical protein